MTTIFNPIENLKNKIKYTEKEIILLKKWLENKKCYLKVEIKKETEKETKFLCRLREKLKETKNLIL